MNRRLPRRAGAWDGFGASDCGCETHLFSCPAEDAHRVAAILRALPGQPEADR
ncbi:MAG: hypothetical protein ABFS23_05740 [Pseudomonadota bacterium]